MNPTTRYILLPISIILVLMFVGCAGSSSIAKIPQFYAPKIQTLKVGMPITAIDTLFGKPNSVTTMKFGAKKGKSWEGIVYKYFTVKDPAFKYQERLLTNTFVFYKDSNPPQLNHWIIEYSVQPEVPKNDKPNS